MTGASVLVTGGTGTFGKAFIRHLLGVGVGRVVVYSRDELKQSEMRATFDDPRLRWFIGDVQNTERLIRAMQGVEYVVHAAAMKQVPACELNPAECIRINIDGTRSVVDAAIEAGILRAIFLSTDKAANPNTHYGACKLAAERLWTQANVYAAGTTTRFSATRYGNVLGSRGSVVDVWRKVPDNRSLGVTHPEMTRFWMTIDDAVTLVDRAFRRMRGGEVFIPKVGASSILTLLAAAMGPTSWVETGIRRNEKLHETLITRDEARYTYEYTDHYRIEPDRTWEDTDFVTAAATVPPDFEFRSDTAPQLSVEQLRRMIG